MKFTHQAFRCLAVILAIVSVLSSCGKKSNSTSAETAVVSNASTIPINPYNPSAPGGTAATFAASGPLVISNASSAVWGDLTSSGASIGSVSNTYVKTNRVTGDQVVLSISGSPQNYPGYTNISASVVVYLSQTTNTYFQTVCGMAPIALRFNNTLLVAGTPGSISVASPRLVAANGCGLLM